MDNDLIINIELAIPLSELRFNFSRSGGKGGQNVNKVETRVELLFDVAHSRSLNDSQRWIILNALRTRTDAEGKLRIVAQESRSQWKNREIAVKKFVALLEKALRPKKKRIATRHTAGSRENRLSSKKRRSTLKQSRKLLE